LEKLQAALSGDGKIQDNKFTIGFIKQADPDFEELYSIENLDHLKMYLTKENGKYELRGYRPRFIKTIDPAEELIHEVLIKWKLKTH
jgi:hypothetical protein